MDTEKLNELCFLLNEKNELIKIYHSCRFKNQYREQIKSWSRMIPQPNNEWVTAKIKRAQKFNKLSSLQKKIYIMETSTALENIRLAILKWTGANRKKVAQLKKELGVTILCDSHSRYYNNIYYETDKLTLLNLKRNDIRLRADAWVFEQVVLKETA